MVTEVMSVRRNAVRLDLNGELGKVHSVFHVSQSEAVRGQQARVAGQAAAQPTCTRADRR